MPAIKIVNQDRDQVFTFNQGDFTYTTPVIVDGNLYGVNLMHGAHFLGTFDNIRDAVEEIRAIYNSNELVHVISGYSDYDCAFSKGMIGL